MHSTQQVATAIVNVCGEHNSKVPYTDETFECVARALESTLTLLREKKPRPLFLCHRLRHVAVGPLTATDLNEVLGTQGPVDAHELEKINRGEIPERHAGSLAFFRMLEPAVAVRR